MKKICIQLKNGYSPHEVFDFFEVPKGVKLVFEFDIDEKEQIFNYVEFPENTFYDSNYEGISFN